MFFYVKQSLSKGRPFRDKNISKYMDGYFKLKNKIDVIILFLLTEKIYFCFSQRLDFLLFKLNRCQF